MRRSRLVSLKSLSFAALWSPFLLPACVSAPSRPHAPSATTEGPPAAPAVEGTATEAPAVTTESVSQPQPQPADEQPAPAPASVPMRARPISGGTLKVLSDGRTVVAADADRDLVYVVDLAAGRLTASVALKPGDEPGRIVEDADGLVHVALRGGGAVATIDPKLPASGALRARRALCSAPRGLAFDKDTNELHVACAGGELVSVGAPPSATTPLRNVFVDRDLRDVVVAKGGRLMVSTFRAASVYVVDGEGQVSAPHSLNRDVRGRMPGVAWRLVGTADGQGLMLHELAQPQALGVFQGAYGTKSPCGAVVSSTVTVLDPGAPFTPPAAPLSGALVAADVAMSPNGQQMAVVSIASDNPGNVVQFFDLGDGHATPGTSNDGCWSPSPGPAMGDAGGATDGDALPPPTSFLPPNGEVVAVAYDARGNVIVQSREPATLQVLTQRREAIVLSQESRFDLGHQVFHAATSGQIACVSCHPEGGEDGRVWQFQSLGARRTQSLRGGIMDTAPFHWSGDEPNMTSLMRDVFQGRMSGAQVDAQRITALGNWIDQIPTVPVAWRNDQTTVARGAALFLSAGCTTCHSGSDFTNGQSVDVGTGGMFQVPQLHGLALRAPYMHNGCAATLRDRFTVGCGGNDKHASGMFTDGQVGDLVAYLETL